MYLKEKQTLKKIFILSKFIEDEKEHISNDEENEDLCRVIYIVSGSLKPVLFVWRKKGLPWRQDGDFYLDLTTCGRKHKA